MWPTGSGSTGPWRCRSTLLATLPFQMASTPTEPIAPLSVPTLTDVLDHPELVNDLPLQVCAALLTTAAAVVTALGARIAAAPGHMNGTRPDDKGARDTNMLLGIGAGGT